MLKPSSWTKGITIEAKVLQKIIVKTITPITLLFIKPKNKNEPPIIELDDIYNKDGFLIKMFGTKSKSWEYENEIRLIYSTSKRKGYNPFALKSIYFGLNMDEMHQIQIIEGLTNRDIRFYKM